MRSQTPNELPRLTVIVPCRNEERFIAQCLNSILENDYPANCLEILVVDGMSTDTTWSILTKYTTQFPFVKALYNKKNIPSAGLNLGIAASTGKIICRVDAHARIAPDYLRKCVQHLCSGDADNVGGTMRTLPSSSTLLAWSIAICMSHKFGTGNSVFRTGSKRPMLTDTVFGGCYWKETFTRIGVFDERLSRSQDIELNQRLRAAGGKILLDPVIHCDYFASPDLGSFLQHNFRDGVWSVLPVAYCKVMPIRWRHLVPLVLVFTLMVLLTLAVSFNLCWLLFIGELGIYMAANIVSSLAVSLKYKNIFLLLMMPIVFAVRHFAYGVGSLYALFKLLANRSLFGAVLRLAGIRRVEPISTLR